MTPHPFIRSAIVKSAKAGHSGRFILTGDQLAVINRDGALPKDNLRLDLGGAKEAIGSPVKGGFVFRVATKQPITT